MTEAGEEGVSFILRAPLAFAARRDAARRIRGQYRSADEQAQPQSAVFQPIARSEPPGPDARVPKKGVDSSPTDSPRFPNTILEPKPMKKCPFCAEEIQDEAVKCRFCGEFLDGDLPAAAPVETLAPRSDPGKLAEIRRLQRIASGRPTRQDSLRKTKGILYLVIIAAILVYSWQWRRMHEAKQASRPDSAEITYEAFNALFGPDASLPAESKAVQFANYRGKTVAWSGDVVYINRGENADPYISVRHRATTRTSDVLLHFNRETRDQLQGVKVGNRIKYTGRIFDYGKTSGFITLKDGILISVD